MQASAEAMTKAMRIFCAIVLLSLGFGHQPVRAFSPIEAYDAIGPQAEDYRLPDGSFAELCIAGKADHPSPHRHGLHACDACVLSASTLLPAPDVTSWLKTTFASVSNFSVTERAFTEARVSELPRSRGPPVSV